MEYLFLVLTFSFCSLSYLYYFCYLFTYVFHLSCWMSTIHPLNSSAKAFLLYIVLTRLHIVTHVHNEPTIISEMDVLCILHVLGIQYVHICVCMYIQYVKCGGRLMCNPCCLSLGSTLCSFCQWTFCVEHSDIL
jgi:hypothetical protein